MMLGDQSAQGQKMQQDARQYADSAPGPNGLMRMADQLGGATVRVRQITEQLHLLSVGLHGPRPEPVGMEKAGAQSHDSLQSRVNELSLAVEALHDAYASVIR